MPLKSLQHTEADPEGLSNHTNWCGQDNGHNIPSTQQPSQNWTWTAWDA